METWLLTKSDCSVAPLLIFDLSYRTPPNSEDVEDKSEIEGVTVKRISIYLPIYIPTAFLYLHFATAPDSKKIERSRRFHPIAT